MDCKKIGELLIEKRGKKTQGEVAEAIGVSLSAIRHYEQGKRSPKDEIKHRLAKFYQASVQELFFQDVFFE